MRRVCLVLALIGITFVCGCGTAVVATVLSLNRGKTSKSASSTNNPPTVFIITPQGHVRGDVVIGYALHDSESNPVDITVEFTTDVSLPEDQRKWSPATPNPNNSQHEGTTALESSPQWVGHYFVWKSDADSDLKGKTLPIILRITPRDAYSVGDGVCTDAFTVYNNAAPEASITTPGGAHGTVQISFTATDAESETAVATITYRIKGETAWRKPTLTNCDAGTIVDNQIEGVTTSPSGESHWFEWDTEADLPEQFVQVEVRIVLADDYQQSAPAITDYFIVNNSVETTWTGAEDNRWDNTNNWTNGVPDESKRAIVPASVVNTPVLSGTATMKALLIESGATLIARGNATINVKSDCTISGKLEVRRGSSVGYGKLVLNVDGDLTISAGGRIKGDGGGYNYCEGPGAGGDGDLWTNPVTGGINYGGGGGGGHGGAGGEGGGTLGGAGGTTYDNKQQPDEAGSGGGLNYDATWGGGKGGAAIKIVVGRTFKNDGAVTADGTNASNGGGGAGGSIWVICQDLEGGGAFSADGGNGSSETGVFYHGGGGGGGGRIAIHVSGTNSFSGSVSAVGGDGKDGGADGSDGTIYP